MGCDIHLHIEVKVDGKWEHYGAPSISRWYRLFGAMAGERDQDEVPIAQPKGFPEDAAILTKMSRKYWDSDGHTDSWLGGAEIAQLEQRLEAWSEEKDAGKWPAYDLELGILHTYLEGNSFGEHWRYANCPLPEGITDVRFVFWFDN